MSRVANRSLKLRRADVLVENSLELDAWVEVAMQGANNGTILRGAPGRIDASRNVPVLDVPTGRVDRSTVVCAFGATLLVFWGLARGPVSGRGVLVPPR